MGDGVPPTDHDEHTQKPAPRRQPIRRRDPVRGWKTWTKRGLARQRQTATAEMAHTHNENKGDPERAEQAVATQAVRVRRSGVTSKK